MVCSLFRLFLHGFTTRRKMKKSNTKSIWLNLACNEARRAHLSTDFQNTCKLRPIYIENYIYSKQVIFISSITVAGDTLQAICVYHNIAFHFPMAIGLCISFPCKWWQPSKLTGIHAVCFSYYNKTQRFVRIDWYVDEIILNHIGLNLACKEEGALIYLTDSFKSLPWSKQTCKTQNQNQNRTITK